MSAAEGNGDLQLMAEYDFKTPIKATVLLYESDEENKASIEKEQNSDVTQDIDHVISAFFEDIHKATRISINKHNTGATSTRDNTLKDSINSNNIREAENQNIHSTVVFDFPNQIEVSSRGCTPNITCYNQDIPRDNPNVTNSYRMSTTLQGNNDRQLLVHTAQTENQSDILLKKADKCIETLLRTVSMHMILIMKAYMDYKMITFNSSDKVVLETARKHFQDTKTRFFYLSFSTVSNIMLPKENDKTFVEKFINNTIELAKVKHLSVKDSDIIFLCTEMFVWVKSHVQHPLLRELLYKDPEPTLANSANNVQVFQHFCTGYNSNSRPQNKVRCRPKPKQRSSQANKVQQQAHHHQKLTTRPPPPYYAPQTWHQETTPLQNNSQNQLLNPAQCDRFQGNKGQVERNRSLSRDSGYMSPLSSSSNDPMCSPQHGPINPTPTPTPVTPMITHVTSLNPGVAFNDTGLCHVCGNVTKQKCLRCYKSYYCSHQCQMDDWKYHAHICSSTPSYVQEDHIPTATTSSNST